MADGIIAPGYEPAALEILKAKKGGKFIVLEAKADYEAPAGEFREVYGVGFYQDRNAVVFGTEDLQVGVVADYLCLYRCGWRFYCLLLSVVICWCLLVLVRSLLLLLLSLLVL